MPKSFQMPGFIDVQSDFWGERGWLSPCNPPIVQGLSFPSPG